MKRAKHILLLVAVLVMVALVIAGCANSQPTTTPKPQDTPKADTVAMEKATYVGTKVCASCHDDANPDKFPATKHASAFKPFSAYPLVQQVSTQKIFDGVNKDKAVSTELDFSKGKILGVMMDHYVVAELPKESGFQKTLYRVATVEKKGDKYELKPASSTDVDKDGKPDWSASEYTCGTCHSPGIADGSPDLGMSCESCHGPGSIHVKAQDKKGTIKSGSEATASCLTCHKGEPVKDANGNLTTQNHYGVRDWDASTHANSKYLGVQSCLTCHGPHKPNANGLLLRETNPNDICLKCHADKKYDVNTIMWKNPSDAHDHITADHSFGAMKYEDLGDDKATKPIEIKNQTMLDLVKKEFPKLYK